MAEMRAIKMDSTFLPHADIKESVLIISRAMSIGKSVGIIGRDALEAVLNAASQENKKIFVYPSLPGEKDGDSILLVHRQGDPGGFISSEEWVKVFCLLVDRGFCDYHLPAGCTFIMVNSGLDRISRCLLNKMTIFQVEEIEKEGTG